MAHSKTKNRSSNYSQQVAFVAEDIDNHYEDEVESLKEVGFDEKHIVRAANYLDAKNKIREKQFGLAIVDLKLPSDITDTTLGEMQNGLDIIRSLRLGNPKCISIAFSMHPDASTLFQLFALGVSFVDKHRSGREGLTWVIKRSMDGHVVFTKGLSSYFQPAAQEAVRWVKFDEYDIKILARIYRYGETDKEIADVLSYGEDNIGNKLRAIYRLAGFNNRQQAATWFWSYVAPVKGLDLSNYLK